MGEQGCIEEVIHIKSNLFPEEIVDKLNEIQDEELVRAEVMLLYRHIDEILNVLNYFDEERKPKVVKYIILHMKGIKESIEKLNDMSEEDRRTLERKMASKQFGNGNGTPEGYLL